MSSSIVRQQSFRGGAVSPEFQGRTHDPRYAISLRTCKNWLPIVHGALVNRAGTQFVATARASTLRAVKFVFSDAQALALEFTDQKIRFYLNGAVVGAPYELATPYVAADLARLDFSQSGDIITITHPSYQTRELTRISNTNWTLTLATFQPPAYFAGNPVILTANNPTQINGAAVSTSDIYSAVRTYGIGEFALFTTGGQVHLYQSIAAANLNHAPDVSPTFWWDWEFGIAKVYANGDYVWDHVDQKLYVSISDNNVGNQPDTSATKWQLAIDQTRPPKIWQWVVTIIYRDAYGVLRETLPSAPTAEVKVALYTDRAATIYWDVPTPPGFSYKLEFYSVYRGRNGLYGFVGDTHSALLHVFKDDGQAPDYGIQPPKGTIPFKVADGNDTANTTKWPGAVTFHEQRRVLARTDAKPSTFFGSELGDIQSHDVNDPPLDSDAYEWRLASQQLEEIRSMRSFGRLCLFTGQGEFSAQGKDGGGITPNSVEIRRHSSHGSSYLAPLEVENALLFNTAKGNYIRDWFFDYNSNGYIGSDVSEFARHFFRGYTIKAWAHQRLPYHLVWIVRSDGKLFSLTYDRGTQTVAFAEHETDGTLIDVCCIPEGTEDALYLWVLRNGSPCVERMVSRDYMPDQRLGSFLDSSLSFDGRNVGATTMKVTGASYAAEDLVTVEASVASFAAGDIDDQVIIDPDGTPTRITITAYTDTTHVTGRLEAPLPAANQNSATAAWGWARDSFGGLAHLNGKSVTVLADGFEQGPFTVAAGAITGVSPPALIAIAGLGYTSDAELLDIAADAVKPNVKGVLKATVEVVDTRSFSAGQDFDTLRPARLREVKDAFGLPELVTDQVDVTIKGTWNKHGRVCVRQSAPLPVKIVAISREVEVGGR